MQFSQIVAKVKQAFTSDAKPEAPREWVAPGFCGIAEEIKRGTQPRAPDAPRPDPYPPGAFQGAHDPHTGQLKRIRRNWVTDWGQRG